MGGINARRKKKWRKFWKVLYSLRLGRSRSLEMLRQGIAYYRVLSDPAFPPSEISLTRKIFQLGNQFGGVFGLKMLRNLRKQVPYTITSVVA